MAGTATVRPIVALAGDAGGAAALAPVLRRLAQQDGIALRLFAYREAPAIWRPAGIDFAAVPEAADEAWLGARIDGAGLLLTATSMNGIDWERRTIPIARRLHVPTLALLDFWSNYRGRFEDRDGRLQLPDRIAVMDALARDEMAACGFPAEILAVTGQPAFDALRERTLDERRREELRCAAGVEDDELLVLYASQPFADLYGSLESARATLGYDETEVHGLCAAALARLAQRHDRRVIMAVRRHPRESVPLPAVPARPALRIVASDEVDRLDAVLAADLVLGMNSVLLMEAVLLGQVVVSVQPNRRLPDPLPSNRDGRSIAVTAAADLDAALERALFDAPWRRQHLLNLRQQHQNRDAAGNVVVLANRLIARH